MNNVYLLKVYPKGRGREVYRTIEISGNKTLNDLCDVILESFDFTDEHMYEFNMDCKMYSRNSYQSDPYGFGPSCDISLKAIGLCKGQKFVLHYDFGDDWMFMISVTKIIENSQSSVSRIIKSKGEVEQYPDYEQEGLV